MKIKVISLEEQTADIIDWDEYFETILDSEVDEPTTPEQQQHSDDITEILLDESNYINYLNNSNRSNVDSYKPDTTLILVKFKEGSIYLYNDKFVTFDELEMLKYLANYGSGLNSYLTRIIRDRYVARYYKNRVLIKPGLEHYDYTIKALGFEDFSDTLVKERLYLKELNDLIEHNTSIYKLRLKQLSCKVNVKPFNYKQIKTNNRFNLTLGNETLFKVDKDTLTDKLKELDIVFNTLSDIIARVTFDENRELILRNELETLYLNHSLVNDLSFDKDNLTLDYKLDDLKSIRVNYDNLNTLLKFAKTLEYALKVQVEFIDRKLKQGLNLINRELNAYNKVTNVTITKQLVNYYSFVYNYLINVIESIYKVCSTSS